MIFRKICLVLFTVIFVTLCMFLLKSEGKMKRLFPATILSYVAVTSSINRTKLNAPVNTADSVTSRNTSNSTSSIHNHCNWHRNTSRVVLIKTHKTGSSTTASIIQRYGYKRNLSFLLPPSSHVISSTKKFSRKMLQMTKFIPNFQGDTNHYEMLTNHVRLDRSEMEFLFPNATFITILRDPVKQLESAFGYFEIATQLGLEYLQFPAIHPSMRRNICTKVKSQGRTVVGVLNSARLVSEKKAAHDAALRAFMENPDCYVHQRPNFWFQLKNGQIYDLGLDKIQKNEQVIDRKILELAETLDFVLINEYYDQSLLVLKKLLCWEFSDILYLSKGVRSSSHRYSIDKNLREKILDWNRADLRLYKYLNETLWKKIEEYGPSFESDLVYFREMLAQIKKTCIQTDRRDKKDRREDKMVLKSNASDFCLDMARNDVDYTKLLRSRQALLSKH